MEITLQHTKGGGKWADYVIPCDAPMAVITAYMELLDSLDNPLEWEAMLHLSPDVNNRLRVLVCLLCGRWCADTRRWSTHSAFFWRTRYRSTLALPIKSIRLD